MTGRAASRGYTLIELTVVVGVFALLAMVVVPSIQAALGVKLREEAGKLAGSVRAMYGEAALGGKTCRLVLDLDDGSFWPECAEGKATIRKTEESSRGARLDAQVQDALSPDEEEERRRVESRNAFAAFTSALAPKHAFPEGVHLASVWTQHQEEPYVSGQAYLYFFPHGQTEKAYLQLTDGDETYTIIVAPMSGRTKVVADKVEAPDR